MENLASYEVALLLGVAFIGRGLAPTVRVAAVQFNTSRRVKASLSNFLESVLVSTVLRPPKILIGWHAPRHQLEHLLLVMSLNCPIIHANIDHGDDNNHKQPALPRSRKTLEINRCCVIIYILTEQ